MHAHHLQRVVFEVEEVEAVVAVEIDEFIAPGADAIVGRDSVAAVLIVMILQILVDLGSVFDHAQEGGAVHIRGDRDAAGFEESRGVVDVLTLARCGSGGWIVSHGSV